ncbi:ABC transporter ATP-binding protein [Orrella marina]|uniref:ABC transporter ATP-binding protein n=1 Tax=Orrella marina TaxID=2163011 RepID=A0A2R4XGT6_9BURK|nr:ABC transporter ATP-binding protein [Orrella marina]AWB33015.1 hypothetical protein DBV39_03985 [Orrella marina]
MDNRHSFTLRDEINQIFQVLPRSSRRRAWGLLALSVLTGLFEVLTIGSVFPIILSLTDPDRLVSWLSRIAGTGQLIDPQWVSWFARPVPVLVVFSGVVIVAGLVRMSLIRQTALFAQHAGAEMSVKALDCVLHQPYAFHVDTTSTRTISLVTHKVTMVVNQVMISLIQLITSIVIAACVLTFLCFVNLAVSLIVLLVLLATYLIVGSLSRRKLREFGQENAEQQTQAIAAVQESIGHVREILLTGLQSFFLERFRGHAHRYRHAQAQSTAITASKRHLVEVIVFLLMASLIYFLLQSSTPKEDVLVILGIFALAAQRLLPIVNQIYTAWASLENGRSPLADVMDVLRLSTDGDKLAEVPRVAFRQSVVLRDVDFQHPGAPGVSGAKRRLFERLSIEIFKGQRIGIMGPSGAGKTTLIDLLAGLHRPVSGDLLVDGHVMDRTRIQSWQRCIGYVPQQVFLSDQTIAENIAIGLPIDAIDMERVRFAGKAAGLEDWITSLPLEYRTLCGENGIRLSGGQRQRIGIARVLYSRKPVLILDEPTSALDVRTEAEIMDSIMALDRDMTVVIVTHRQSLLSRFDQVCWVEQGKVKPCMPSITQSPVEGAEGGHLFRTLRSSDTDNAGPAQKATTT